MPIMHTSTGEEALRQVDKKVRKNRYMKGMRGLHGRYAWGMPFSARLGHSHGQLGHRMHLPVIDTAQAMLSKKSAELLLLVAAARCA